MSEPKERLKLLEQLIVTGVQNNPGQILSIETLLDGLIVLYDECCSSTLRREKSITNFVDFGKLPITFPDLYVEYTNIKLPESSFVGEIIV